MNYSQREKEQLGSSLLQYIIILQNQIFAKLKSQLKAQISTGNLEYRILKWEGVANLEIGLDEIGIHSLFAPDGCNLSGDITIVVLAEVPGKDGNLSRQYQFTINFESAPVRYDFASGIFELLDDIAITYIREYRP